MMESLGKSAIMKIISMQLDKQESILIECRLKKSTKIITVRLNVAEEEHFIDEKGVRWIRG